MSIWGPFYFTINNAEATRYRVKLYGQPVTTSNKLNDAHVTFKYGDLVNRAIAAKRVSPSEKVEIAFAIYRLTKKVYIGIDPSDSKTYGTVAGKDQRGSSTEKLLYSLIKAAKKDVSVRLLVQKDGEGDSSSDDISDLTDYLTDPDNWGGDYNSKRKNLSIRHVTWGVGSDQQMHNKFMLLSHVKGDTHDYLHCTYTTTANVDPWNNFKPKKKYYQTGVTIYDHEPLYKKYSNYFNLIWENYGNQANFSKEVLDAHDKNDLNYDNQNDPYLSAYFYPICEGKSWEPEYNPIAKILKKLPNQPDSNRYIKINMAFIRSDFWGKFCKLVDEADGSSKINVKIKTHDDGGVDYPDWVNRHNNICETHAKNYQFVIYEDDGTKEHYSITGSTNAKENGFLKKANNILVIKDQANYPDNKIYRAFKEMFEAVKS